MLGYRILADVVLVLHATYVAFVVLGLVAVLYGLARGRSWARSFWFRASHLAAIGLLVVLTWAGLGCPLTDLENYFRAQAGEVEYPGDFVAYWLHAVLFFELPDWVFVVAYSLFGALVLATFLLAPPRVAGKHAARREEQRRQRSPDKTGE